MRPRIRELRWHLTYLRGQLPEFVRTHLVVTPDHVALAAPTDVEAFLERGQAPP